MNESELRAGPTRRSEDAQTPPGAGAPSEGRPRVRLVAADLDGVVWLGGNVLPDAPAALNDVIARGLDLRYVTNNSTAHRETVSAKLAAAGLPAGTERVLTSGYVTARWLRQRLPKGATVLVVGEMGLLRELTDAGLRPFHAGEEGASCPSGPPDTASLVPAAGGSAAGEKPVAAGDAVAAGKTRFQAVVVGMDRGFTFSALAAAQASILAGALFVGTNPDPTFPTRAGLLPGTGSIVAAVATAAQKKAVFMGKPGLGLAEVLAAETGVRAGETLFIGDRLSTDIGMGRRAGMITALVLTGVTSREDLGRVREEGGDDLPDHVLSTLADLPPLLDTLTPLTP